MKIQVKDFCQVVGGRWFGQEPVGAWQDKVLDRVSIDSRDIGNHDLQSSDKGAGNRGGGESSQTLTCKHGVQSRDMGAVESRRSHSPLGGGFFAIKGQRRDGHDFVWDVLKKDISVVVVCSDFIERFSSQLREIQCDRSFLICSVEDTLVALHRLACHWRQQNKWKVIGITGSAGKTTTKHFCQLLLERHFKVQSSSKSFNNYYGVPLALLSAPPDLDFFYSRDWYESERGDCFFKSDGAAGYCSGGTSRKFSYWFIGFKGGDC